MLARKLRKQLGALGVDYHVRTLTRQFAGSVSSVPPDVEAAMRHLLIGANGLREPTYLATLRIVPLALLGLLFNRPTHNGPSRW